MRLPLPIVSAIARRWPFANGSGRFIDKFGGSAELGSGIRLCRTSDGFDINVIETEHIGRHILLSGQFDRTPVQVLLDFAEVGDVMLDVGANIGYVSCCFLQNITGSSVIAVEPQPEIVDLLRLNLSHFSSDRSRVIEAALSENDDTIEFKIDPVNRGASSIHGSRNSHAVQVQSVCAERLLAELEKLDLIKMDVEGHEEHVLRSAEAQLSRLQPRAIQFEDREGKADPSGAIGTILGRIGYDVFGIKKDLLATVLLPIREAADCRFNDYLALSRQRASPAVARRKYRLI